MTGDNGSVNRLEFKGIVRSTSAQNNADGNCEEIINMRYDTGVWRVVGKKHSIVAGVSYESVYVHKYGNFENYIGVKDGRVVWFDPVTRDELQEICRVSGKFDLNQINNILLVKDPVNIHKSVFTDGRYRTSISNLPRLPELAVDTSDRLELTDGGMTGKIEVHGTFNGTGGKSIGGDALNFYRTAVDWKMGRHGNDYYRFYPDVQELESANGIVKGAYNSHVNVDETHRSGYVFLAYCYQLYDGSETKMTPLRLVKLGTFTQYPLLYVRSLVALDDDPSDVHANLSGYTVEVAPQSVVLNSLKVNIYDLPDYETYKDIIAQVNVYVSQPIDYYDWDNLDVSYLVCKNKDGELWNMRALQTSMNGLPIKVLKATDVSRILLYRVEEFKFGEVPMARTINFKNLTTNKTMPVDTSGWFNTTGDMYVYNNRLHLFNINQTFADTGQIAFASAMVGGVMSSFFFYIKNSTGDDAIVKTQAYVFVDKGGSIIFPDFISFADSRAYKVEVYINYLGEILKKVIFLDPSNTYNVSFALDIGTARIENIERVDSMDAVENKSIVDSCKILVSSPSNPYTFPPDQSYLVSGEILNLAVNSEQISASQIGTFPLYVFTTDGIYALETGGGNVLYSNVIPVSAEVSVEGSSVFQTKSGIVFVTTGGLKLISGAQVTDLSAPLKGLPDMSIRRSTQYMRAIDHEYSLNILQNLSRVDFRKYIQGAVMGYDIVHDELVVSDPEYQYSYVYSFESRMWHKITEVFKNFQRNVCLVKGVNGFDVCDVRLEDEEILPVWIQTRPINVDSYGFKTVYRSALRGELKPLPEEVKKYYGCYVFASNDLSDWFCVAESIIATHLNYAILNRIGSSFRYFVVMTGGYVEPGHCVALFEVDGESKYGGRIR